MFKIGEEVGIVKLKNAYDSYVTHVLGGYLERLHPRKTGKRRPSAKFKVIKPLPSVEEYSALRAKIFTVSLDSLVSEAYSEIETLRDEMQEWFDNLTDNLQQTERGQRVEEAADTLNSIDMDVAPDVLNHLELLYLPNFDATSRSSRASEAADMLRSAKEAIYDWIAEICPNGEDDTEESRVVSFGDGDDKQEVSVNWADLKSFADQLESNADELDNVEFVGMYD